MKETLTIIRISCNDPDATDSDSADQSLPLPRKAKRFVKERVIQADCMENHGEKKSNLKSRLPAGSKGRRKSAKVATDVRDPVTEKKLQLGTCDTMEKTREAHDVRRTEIKVNNLSVKNSNKQDKNRASSLSTLSTMVVQPLKKVAEHVTEAEIRMVDEEWILAELQILQKWNEEPPSLAEIFPEDHLRKPYPIWNNEIHQNNQESVQYDNRKIPLTPEEKEAEQYFNFDDFPPWGSHDWGPLPSWLSRIWRLPTLLS